MLKITISTSVWSAQHPNAGWDIQLVIHGGVLFRSQNLSFWKFNRVCDFLSLRPTLPPLPHYSWNLKSDLVWISNSPKEVELQLVWISNGIWNSEAQPFEVRTNGRHFFQNQLKSGQKRPDFEWSGFQMFGTMTIAIAKTRPFENQTIWNPTLKKSGF